MVNDVFTRISKVIDDNRCDDEIDSCRSDDSDNRSEASIKPIEESKEECSSLSMI